MVMAHNSVNLLEVEFPAYVDLEASLGCGQAFRWNESAFPGRPDMQVSYKGVIDSTAVFLGQKDPRTSTIQVAFAHGIDGSVVRKKILDYFSCFDDVETIERSLAMKGDIMATAVEFGRGLRILRQDPWECLASYILSVRKNIPAIKGNVANLAQALGRQAGLGEFRFPTAEAVLEAGTDVLRECGCGFRDKYLLDAAARVVWGDLDLGAVAGMPLEDARDALMKVKGVGPKVSACVLLFAYHRLEVFPVDVWIGRVMSRFYLDGSCDLKEAGDEGVRRFGPFAGYAQEHLYYYARNHFSAANL